MKTQCFFTVILIIAEVISDEIIKTNKIFFVSNFYQLIIKKNNYLKTKI